MPNPRSVWKRLSLQKVENTKAKKAADNMKIICALAPELRRLYANPGHRFTFVFETPASQRQNPIVHVKEMSRPPSAPLALPIFRPPVVNNFDIIQFSRLNIEILK